MAGETEAAINKASLGMVPITCVEVLVEWEGLGRGREAKAWKNLVSTRSKLGVWEATRRSLESWEVFRLEKDLRPMGILGISQEQWFGDYLVSGKN